MTPRSSRPGSADRSSAESRSSPGSRSRPGSRSSDGDPSSDEPAGSQGGAVTPLYDLAGNDPRGELVDASGLTSDDIAQVDAIMAAMARLRKVEQQLAAVARQRLALNETDLRAMHLLIVAANRNQTVTPGELARQLGITTASTTKMLDRLERAGHVFRRPHPADRRALAITVAPSSRQRAVEVVGRQQAGRFGPAAALTSAEREIVRAFLTATADALESRIADADDPGAAG